MAGRMPVLDERDVYIIRVKARSGTSVAALSKEFGVSSPTIRNVINRRGVYDGDRLTEAWDEWEAKRRQVVEMRDTQGKTFSEIGKHFGASKQWAHKTYADGKAAFGAS